MAGTAPRANPKPVKHYAVITSRRRGTYMCPSCGVLGGIEEAIRHSVQHQWCEPRLQRVEEPAQAH